MASPSPSPSTAARVLGPDSNEELLLEARMGKMIVENRTVRPDLRKGVLRLIQGEGFLRVQWKERSQDYPDDDILVFPHEASFEKVQQSSGRVYLLNFKQDDRKYFFWMQEPDEKRDSEICDTVDYFLNYPSPESDEEEEDNVHFGEESSQVAEISNMDGENRPFSAVPIVPQIASTEGAVQLADLQRILSSITPVSGTLGSGLLQQDTGPSLTDLLKPELVIPLLDSSLLDENLTQFLPEGSWTPQAIAELLQSPQFHQQVDAFTHVLRSGQIDLSQFGIDSSNYNFTVLSFLEAIEDQVAKKATSSLAASSSEDRGMDQETDHHMEEDTR